MRCGIDEVGRGPLAGPVTAAAVVLPDGFPVSILNDSKKLSAKKREQAYLIITQQASNIGVGWAWPEEIDKINIHQATLLAMQRAFRDLTLPVSCALIDGLHAPVLPVPCTTIVKGDSKVNEIMAASIVAKVVRDRWMLRYSWIDSRYGYDKHKGYPTAEHRKICREIGASPIQRRSFRVR